MDLATVRRLIQGGETDQVEFKRKVRHPEKIIRELVAFANTTGGHLLIGVGDDCTMPGLRHADEEDFIMQKSIRELIRPGLEYHSGLIPLSESRAIVHYHVPESRIKPHYALEHKNQRWGKAYIRVGEQTLQASREVCQVLKSNKREYPGSFPYGEKEKLLMNYLGSHDHITVAEYQSLADIKKRDASDILISLTVHNVLRIIPREKGDWFVHED